MDCVEILLPIRRRVHDRGHLAVPGCSLLHLLQQERDRRPPLHFGTHVSDRPFCPDSMSR